MIAPHVTTGARGLDWCTHVGTALIDSHLRHQKAPEAAVSHPADRMSASRMRWGETEWLQLAHSRHRSLMNKCPLTRAHSPKAECPLSTIVAHRPKCATSAFKPAPGDSITGNGGW